MCAKPTPQALPSHATENTTASLTPELGKPCHSGPNRCIDTLKSSAYLQCNSETWIKRECPTDQVCVNTPDAIACIQAPTTIATSKANDIVLQGECALDANHTCVNPLLSKFYNKCQDYAWTQQPCHDGKVCQSTKTGTTCIQPYAADTSENPNLPKGLCEEDTEYCFAAGQDRRFSRCHHHSWKTLKCSHTCFQNKHRTFCANPNTEDNSKSNI
ncbi:hypothetical protein DSO57_1031096 [Entomophthora muscae]|uniref:Uncharacterized protein n=1 Tax=Entomophthora muscae TaxID=34485 RepID=A0ACC2UM03_9FUNG|nr:hypothetical protein DSO57_1031096 [Entomophthora muscae]